MLKLASKHFKLALAVLPLACASAFALRLLVPGEPSYGGKRLSTWLRGFEADKLETRIRAGEAVRHIGSKAVPLLADPLQHPRHLPKKPSTLGRLKKEAVAFLAKHSILKAASSPEPDLRFQALAALDALGPTAKDALPALERLLQENPPDPQAIYVIARIGPAGVPLMTKSLTNQEKLIRMQARACLDMMKSHSGPLYPSASDSESAEFGRRMCMFNLMIMAGAHQERVRQHPEWSLPSRIDAPPPSRLPNDFNPNSLATNRSIQTGL